MQRLAAGNVILHSLYRPRFMSQILKGIFISPAETLPVIRIHCHQVGSGAVDFYNLLPSCGYLRKIRMFAHSIIFLLKQK